MSEPNQLEFLQKVNSLKGNENIKNVCFYYKRNNGTSFGTSNIFYVKLKSVNDFNKLQQVAIQKNLQIINQIPNMPTWYILALNKTTIGDVIAVTNQIYETGLFEDVDPAFMFKLDTRQQNNQISNPSNIYDTCANDTYFNTQWGLKSNANISHDIKACNAWPISQGDGIKVAVVDFGIGKLNPDLADNISNLSLNTIYGGSTSATIDYNHGSAVASIIAAVKDNNLQIAGIAPKSKIMDVKFENNDEPLITLSKIASGISWAWQNGADVINNSWGFLEEPNLNSSLLENAINDAITLGRNGKGTLVVFGAGNYSDNITYPANFNDDIITLKPSSLKLINPNPAYLNVTVSYKLNTSETSYLMIIGCYATTGTTNNYILDENSTQTTINIENYPSGFYTIALICNGQIVDAKTLIKN